MKDFIEFCIYPFFAMMAVLGIWSIAIELEKIRKKLK